MSSGPFSEISRSQLEDAKHTDYLYRFACRQNWWQRNHQSRIDFHALAEYALRKGDNPGAMFIYLIKNKAIDRIAGIDDDAGAQRVKTCIGLGYTN